MLGEVPGPDGRLGSGAEPGRTGDDGVPAGADGGCEPDEAEPTRGRGGVG